MIDRSGRLLLFRFVHRTGALEGRDYWATPGGALEAGEDFMDAAIRELAEETGILDAEIGPELGHRKFDLQLADGEIVKAEERFFLVQTTEPSLSREGWTAHELEVMAEHRWWSRSALQATADLYWPSDLIELLEGTPFR